MANLYAPDGSKIIGTVEIIPACTAGIEEGTVTRGADGKFQFQYDGATDVNWEAQYTAFNEDGERLFWDEAGDYWPENELELRDD
jgi:hypothetical protein